MVIDWGRASISYPAASEQGTWSAITTRGDGRPTFVRSRVPEWASTDLEFHFLRCRIRIDRTDLVGGLELRLSDTTSFRSFAAFEVPFFTDRAFNRVHSGEWTTVSFGLGDARLVDNPNLERPAYLGWFLRDTGGAGVVFEFTEVELVPRPEEGVVSFTFDDGWLDQLAAAPVMSKYGLGATAYVMPRQIGEPGYMTGEHLRELTAEYGWEVSAHHAVPFTELSLPALEAEVAYSFKALGELGYSTSARHLAYPLGKQNGVIVRDVVHRYFASARLASGGLETLPPADWHLLRAVNVTPAMSAEEVASIVDRARAHGQWAILMFHHLVESPRQDTDYGLDEFERLVRLVAESGTQVMTVGQVWSRYGTKLVSGQ